MAVAQAAGRIAAPAPRHWWRGRAGVVVAVVIAMLAAYLVWKSELAWPSSLVWKSLAGYLDRFQAWLSDNRNVAHPNFAFVVFNGFATFLDDLVSWLTSLFHQLTWAGTTVLGTLVVLRFGGRWEEKGSIARTHAPCRWCHDVDRVSTIARIVGELRRAVPIELGSFVPWKNPLAVYSYGVGLAALTPVLGLVLGPIAVLLGLIGFIHRRLRPKVHGTNFAVAGMLLGTVNTAFNALGIWCIGRGFGWW